MKISSITNYLIPSCNSDPKWGDDMEARIVASIEEIENNKFFLLKPDSTKTWRHFVLKLSSQYRYLGEKDEKQWSDGFHGELGRPLTFFYSGIDKPSVLTFSRHIHKECYAASLSDYLSDGKFFRRREDIGLDNVWRFTLHLNKDYTKTVDFIRDYDFWHERLYQTQKWMAYISGELDWQGGHVAIGDRFYEFLWGI